MYLYFEKNRYIIILYYYAASIIFAALMKVYNEWI